MDSDAEERLYEAFNRQHIYFKPGFKVSRMTCDFGNYDKKLIVEVDGRQHFEEEGIDTDQVRDFHLANWGYTIIRVPAKYAYNFPDEVAKEIKKQFFLEQTDSQIDNKYYHVWSPLHNKSYKDDGIVIPSGNFVNPYNDYYMGSQDEGHTEVKLDDKFWSTNTRRGDTKEEKQRKQITNIVMLIGILTLLYCALMILMGK